MKFSTVLTTLIISSFFTAVVGVVTLRLSGDPVYGQSFSLVCYATTVPLRFATFYRKHIESDININDLDARLGTVSITTCKIDQVNLTRYNYSCSSDQKEISLIVPAENLMEHNTLWKCTNAEGPFVISNNNLTVFVNVPVSSLQLSPNGKVGIDEFETNKFTCTTSFCRPQATISWWKNNVSITNTADIPSYDQNVTIGSLFYTGNRQDNGHIIVCKASNGYSLEKTSQQSVVLNVRYAPVGSPSIANYSNGSIFSIIENTPEALSCSITGGNPLASLSWNCFDFVGSVNIVEQTITSNITLNVNRSRTGQLCQCLSVHELQGNRTAIIFVQILYPPVVTPFQSPVKVVEGSPLELVCRSDGNPIPDYTWDPLGEDKENRSRLYHHNITRNNSGTYRCKANSTMKTTSGNAVNVSDSKDVVIDVLYPPIVTPFQSPVKVVEGSPLELICRSDGNPTPDYTWDPLGENIENRSRLYYHNITRNNSGTYRCKANSTMRPTNGNPVNVSDSKDVVIDVLYGASISAFITKKNNNTIMENDSLLLHCQVNSNPLSDIFLYYEDNSLLKEEKNALNLNYTKKAECLDAGVYTCHANNSIMNGYSASSDLQIMVACSPRFDHRKNVSTVYYTGLNSNVTLEVYVIAYPEPANITWHHRENETDMWQRVTYQPPVSGGLSSRILIQLTSRLDFGYYMVTLGNYLGKYNKTYSIIPESIPGVPKNINVTKRGPHSVTLEWAPGFAGGHPQHFIIEYARQSDEDWIKSDEISDVESPMQSYVLSGLQPKTFYQLRMYAGNKIGFSEKTQVVTATTLDSFADKDQADVLPVGAIAGGIPGAVVTVVLVILVVIFLRRRWLRSKDKDDNFTGELRKMERPESGLVDNPVYDSSGTSASSGAVGVEYAVAVKKTRVDDARNLYAEVNKKKNKKKGDIYENTDIVGRNPSKENVYTNSNNEKTETSGDNVYENPGVAASHGHMTNKDGLLYADLMLDPPTAKNGKPVIWGIENRTEYADIAHGRRGQPLPDRDEEKETNRSRANN